MQDVKNKLCSHCKSEFTSRWSTAKFCSRFCQKTSWRVANIKKTPSKAVCVHCQVEYGTTREHIQKFCSFSCQQKHNSNKNPQWAANRKIRRRVKFDKAIYYGTDRELYNFAIKEIYSLAKERTQLTGIPWEVDHIIPINSKLVCGLHTPCNLQVIPARHNRLKSNIF